MGLLVVHRRGRACEVIDLIHFQLNGVDHVVAKKLKVGQTDQMGDVILAASEEVVHANDLQGAGRPGYN